VRSCSTTCRRRVGTIPRLRDSAMCGADDERPAHRPGASALGVDRDHADAVAASSERPAMDLPRKPDRDLAGRNGHAPHCDATAMRARPAGDRDPHADRPGERHLQDGTLAAPDVARHDARRADHGTAPAHCRRQDRGCRPWLDDRRRHGPGRRGRAGLALARAGRRGGGERRGEAGGEYEGQAGRSTIVHVSSWAEGSIGGGRAVALLRSSGARRSAQQRRWIARASDAITTRRRDRRPS
jgi:hypothetical protein